MGCPRKIGAIIYDLWAEMENIAQFFIVYPVQRNMVYASINFWVLSKNEICGLVWQEVPQ